MMFGTNEQFNLERLPFSAYGAFLSVYQDVASKKMFLSICRAENTMLDRPNLLELDVEKEGEKVFFTYSCTSSKLTFQSKVGKVEFAFERDPSVLRIRATGVDLLMRYIPRMHEGGCQWENGEIELGFGKQGKLRIAPVLGTLETDLRWNFRAVRPDPFTVRLVSNGSRAEAAVFEYESTCPSKTVFEPFDDIVSEKQKEFDAFCENYSEVPLPYRDMAEKAKYMVWSSFLGPRGSLTQPVVYMHKLFLVRAFGWQQCFHAIAMKRSVKEAWRLILAFFDYQNEIGGIPDHINDIGQIPYETSKPPIHGYAVRYLLDRYDTTELSREDYLKMYEKLSAYTSWWLCHHDHARTGYPSYYHPDESGYDESSTFDEGLPIQSPDLLSYTVFNCEACSRLAQRLGNEAEEKLWNEMAEQILRYLTDVLWDGEQFRAYLPGKKAFYKCGSITQLSPIMLGKRLPKEITKVLIARLTDPKEFRTDYGMTTENLQSEKLVMRAFTRGAVVAPTMFFLLNGINDAGYSEEARIECTRYLNALNHKGLALGIHSFRFEPALEREIVPIESGMSVGFPFSSWVASVFLALAENLL